MHGTKGHPRLHGHDNETEGRNSRGPPRPAEGTTVRSCANLLRDGFGRINFRAKDGQVHGAIPSMRRISTHLPSHQRRDARQDPLLPGGVRHGKPDIRIFLPSLRMAGLRFLHSTVEQQIFTRRRRRDRAGLPEVYGETAFVKRLQSRRRLRGLRVANGETRGKDNGRLKKSMLADHKSPQSLGQPAGNSLPGFRMDHEAPFRELFPAGCSPPINPLQYAMIHRRTDDGSLPLSKEFCHERGTEPT